MSHLATLSDRQEAEALVEAELRDCERSIGHFIANWVWIEDKTAAEKVSRFGLWPAQWDALQAFLACRLIIALKARQLGFTWLALAYAVWRMVFKPGYTVVAVSKTDADAIELIDYRLAQILLPRLPGWLIRRKSAIPRGWSGPTWEATKHELIIRHPNGALSRFRADAGADAGRSLTADLVLLDEWAANQWADQIWEAAYPTINRPGSSPEDGQVCIISTNKRATLFEEQVKAAREGANGFRLLFWPWTADPRRNSEWYEATRAAMPQSYRQEYPATIDEALSAGEKTAFPEFDVAVHVVKPFPIPAWWRRWRANDPGYSDPFAWYWLAADEDGNVYIYREFTRLPSDSKLSYSEQAARVAALSVVGTEVPGRPPEMAWDDEAHELRPVQEHINFTVTGMDAFNAHPDTGKAHIDYYADGGLKGFIKPVHGSGARAAMAATWHEYLKVFDGPDGRPTARLKIFSTCRRLIEMLPQLVVDERNPEAVADGNDDQYQAAGYGLQAWHAERSKPPEAERGVIASHKDKLAKKHLQHRKRLM